MKFEKTYPVRATEMSPEYRLKKYYIGMYFQECFAEYAASVGLAAFDTAKIGRTWLTSDARVDFTGQMPFWREDVKISTWVGKITPARIFVSAVAECGGAEIACGESVHVIADAKTHKPERSAGFAEKFGIGGGRAFPDETFGKPEIPDGADGIFETSQVVRFDELDFNMHLNNVRYVPRALEALPEKFRTERKLLSYRIKFLREAKFGDTIVSRAVPAGNECLHVLAKSSDGAELCRMKSVWA